VPAYSVFQCWSAVVESSLKWQVQLCLQSDELGMGFALTSPTTTTAYGKLPDYSLVIGRDAVSEQRGQTLIGDSAVATSENSFAYGFPIASYNHVHYKMGLKKNLAIGATGYLTSDGNDLTTDLPHKVPTFPNYNNSIFRFDADLLLKQSNSTNCGFVRLRVLVKVDGSGTPTIVSTTTVDEVWSGLSSMSVASQVTVSVDATYKGLKFQVSNTSGVAIRCRAVVTCTGMTNLA